MLWILDLFSLAWVAAGFALVWMNYPRLPERVPIHFGLNGKPDSWGIRVWIWLLPVVGLFTWVICAFPAMAGPAAPGLKLGAMQEVGSGRSHSTAQW